jgi:hypothetical protein
MLINEKPLQHWMDHFYGYGSWDAKIWFVAYEEGGGDLPEEVSEKLTYFHDVHKGTNEPTLCDIRELYRRVTFEAEGPRADMFKTLHGYRFDSNAILHGVWRNLISFVHGFNGEVTSDRLEYQKKIFASASAKREALIQLYPLPSPHDHAWYYSWLDLPHFRFLRRRSTYEEKVYPQRIRTILSRIKAHTPDVVVMYGMSNINGLKKSVQDSYPSSKFKMVKGTKLEIPQHHITQLDGTTLVITTQMPALKHNRVETGFDWEEFGKKVTASQQHPVT